jgi:hypothetical protein
MSATQRIFQVPLYEDLLSPSGHASGKALAVLERLLEDLLDAAKANIIPAPAAAPDGSTIIDAFAAIENASEQFEVAPGISLADHLWTHAAPYHCGIVGRQLADTARSARPVQGFLALFANEVRSPLLYSANKAPFRLAEVVGTRETVGGPYLALAVCEGTPDGGAEAILAFAMPVLSAQRFIPVSSELDRDVLRAIERLQLALDAHGVECTVERIRRHTSPGVTMLNLTLTQPGRTPHHFAIAVDPAGMMSAARLDGDAIDFVVTWQNWQDGRFVAWLETSLIA